MKKIDSFTKVLFYDLLLTNLKEGAYAIIVRIENGDMVADIIPKNAEDLVTAMIASIDYGHVQ